MAIDLSKFLPWQIDLRDVRVVRAFQEKFLKTERKSPEAKAIEDCFDEQFYLSQNPDMAASDLEPIEHYLQIGWKLDLDPSPDFSTGFYLDTYRDIKDGGIQPLVHYVLFGKDEGRVPRPARQLLLASEEVDAVRAYFDEEYYISQQPDLKGTWLQPLEHYLALGWKQGLDPSPEFSTSYYLKNNPEIERAGVQPFVHYVMHGKRERREPAPYHVRDRKTFRPLVSIIVPNYNHARFLPERLASIRNQTYDNFELILLDDCSKDDSIEVLDKLAEEFTCPVTKLFNDKNSGNVFAQWAKGVKAASGELIWICESDDFCELDFVEKLVYHFVDRSVMLAFGGIQFCNQDGYRFEGMDNYREGAEKGIWDRVISRPANEWFAGAFGVNNVVANVGGCIFRNQNISDDIWETARTYKIAGDWYLYSQIIRGGTMVYNPDAVAYFRQHETNTSASNFNKRYFYDEHQMILRNLCSIWDIPKETRKRFIENVRLQYNHHKMPETEGDFDDYFPICEMLELRREQKHILIAMLGFISGGGEVFAINLANELINEGHFVSVFSLTMFEQNKQILASLDARVPVFHRGDFNETGIQAFAEKAGISVIHSHMASCDDYFFNTEEPLKNIPYVVSLHGSHDTLGEHRKLLVGKLIKGVSHWVYTADKNLKIFEDISVDEGRLTKIANAMPVDERPFPQNCEELGISPEAIVFTLVARGIKRKGWHVSIAAFKRLQQECTDVEVHLLLVGSGDEADEAVATIEPADNITYLGYQSHISGLYRMSDCAIAPTRFEGESFPLCVIQALQEGVPVIATDVGEIANMLTRKKSIAGILLEPCDDSDEFSDRLFEAMSTMTIRSRRKKFQKKARDVKSKFDMKVMVSGYLDIYDLATKTNELNL